MQCTQHQQQKTSTVTLQLLSALKWPKSPCEPPITQTLRARWVLLQHATVWQRSSWSHISPGPKSLSGFSSPEADFIVHHGKKTACRWVLPFTSLWRLPRPADMPANANTHSSPRHPWADHTAATPRWEKRQHRGEITADPPDWFLYSCFSTRMHKKKKKTHNNTSAQIILGDKGREVWSTIKKQQRNETFEYKMYTEVWFSVLPKSINSKCETIKKMFYFLTCKSYFLPFIT